MKEKLIKLFEQFSFTCYTHCKKAGEYSCKECQHEQLADYLIQNGVILPLCKSGDTVYIKGEPVTIAFINIDETITYCVEFDCGERDCSTCPFYEDDVSWEGEHDCKAIGYYEFTADDIGVTVFLTKEEAEKKLRENKGE